MAGLVEEIVCGSSGPSRASRVIGGMIPEPPSCALDEAMRWAGVNLGDPHSHPEVLEAVKLVVGFASRSALGHPYPGWVTSGATESNILAVLHAREEGYERVVYFPSAHYSISKAARIAGLEEIVVRAIDGYAPDLAALEAVLEENPGSLVVATLGTTETGYLDPVEAIARVARRYDSIVHVDAAFTGSLLAYLGNPKAPRALDSMVRTMALDMHKIPEAPIGVGVLLAYDESVIEDLWFEAPYIPGGRQFGLLGTRPAAPLMAAAFIAERLENAMPRLTGELMRAASRVYGELVEAGPYGSPHPPESPVVCLTNPRHWRIHRELQARGYRAYRCPSFGGVRLAIMPHTLGGALEEWLECLKMVARGASD